MSYQSRWIEGAKALVAFMEAHPELIPPEGAFDSGLVVKFNATHHVAEAVAALRDGAEPKPIVAGSLGCYRRTFGPHVVDAYFSAGEVAVATERKVTEWELPPASEIAAAAAHPEEA